MNKRSNKEYLISIINRFAQFIPDRTYLQIMFYLRMGQKLNLENPKTFNEKLQWLKQHGRGPDDVIMTDKYAVKDYIANRIGSKYVIPLLGVWDNFDDINFEELPNQFVLKCSHDSGGLVVCKNKEKFDFERARTRINKCLKRDFYVYSREKSYKGIPRRIIAEEYMEDYSGELRDYKFFCFNGEVKTYKIDYGRFVEHGANYYDVNGKLLDFEEVVCPRNSSVRIEIPQNINEMIELANTLSKGYPFLRVDFYNINGHIYFGEFTFSPAGGMGPFNPEEWDYKLGSWIKLPID